jgi:streptomycin 6-kinase
MLGEKLLAGEVAAAVVRRWPDRGGRWCREVEGELAQLCQRYGVRARRAMHSRYGLVVDVATEDGQALVFRASPDPAGADQQRASATLAKIGVGPIVHECTVTDTGTWTVTERITPGTPIGDMDWNTIDPVAICATLRSLVNRPVPSPPMTSVIDWLRDRLQAGDLTDLAPGREPASDKECKRALAVLRELERTHVPELCHGDASPWNLLMEASGRVVLIDPRGVMGEVAYDVGIVALKAAPFISPAISGPQLAGLVGVDANRVSAWITVADAARV